MLFVSLSLPVRSIGLIVNLVNIWRGPQHARKRLQSRSKQF